MEHDTEADIEILVATAVMYYEHHMSQEAIARRLGTSRSSVSRLLARARDLGIVSIQIEAPNPDPALPGRLASGLGLDAVHVAPGRALEAEPGPVLAGALAGALDDAHLAPGDVAVVSWGRAVASVSRYIRPRDAGVVVVPAMGGQVGDRPWFQPNDIARTFACALNGQARFLNAPAVVSPELDRALRAEADTRAVLDLWDGAKVALVSVGAWPKPGTQRRDSRSTTRPWPAPSATSRASPSRAAGS